MRKWEKQTSEAPLRKTSPPALGSSPIGGVEHGKKRSSSRKNVKNSSNPIFQVPLPFFPQGPQELLQKRLQTDATWHNLKILTEPQEWSRYEKDLWNARSKPENKKKRVFCGRFPLSNASTLPGHILSRVISEHVSFSYLCFLGQELPTRFKSWEKAFEHHALHMNSRWRLWNVKGSAC